jgi:hypothetical protein
VNERKGDLIRDNAFTGIDAIGRQGDWRGWMNFVPKSQPEGCSDQATLTGARRPNPMHRSSENFVAAPESDASEVELLKWFQEPDHPTPTLRHLHSGVPIS